MSYQPPPPPQPPYVQPTKSNGMGVAALVLGIIGLIFFWFPYLGIICALLAVILGAVAMRAINASGGAQGGKGMAIAGLVLGLIALAFDIIILIAVGVTISSNS